MAKLERISLNDFLNKYAYVRVVNHLSQTFELGTIFDFGKPNPLGTATQLEPTDTTQIRYQLIDRETNIKLVDSPHNADILTYVEKNLHLKIFRY